MPSRPMITAAMPPSTLSTTFLSVSANTFHLDEHGTRSAHRELVLAPSNHIARLDRRAAQGGEVGGAVRVAHGTAVDDAVLRRVARVAGSQHRALRDRALADHVDVDLVA